MQDEQAALAADRAKLGRRVDALEGELLGFAARQPKAPPVQPEVEVPTPSPTSVMVGGRPRMTFYIDIISGCNLRCPSCPVSDKPSRNGTPPVRGLMTKELLRKILDKATAECSISSVGLFNWTEPMLHPDVAELVTTVKSYGLFCSISSNLNVLRDVDAVLSAGLDWFRVSVSGFTQENYGHTHRGGDIDVVKANMRELAAARRRTGSKADIEVFFHRYLGNLDDEVNMRHLAEDLGFRFVAAWAQMMPVEKVLSYVDPDEPLVTLDNDDKAIIERLALPLGAAIAATTAHQETRCSLQDDYMTIDVAGNVNLCCAVSNRVSNRLASFLDTPLIDLQQRKAAHTLCGKCMSKGLPIYLEHRMPKTFEALARDNILGFYSRAGTALRS